MSLYTSSLLRRRPAVYICFFFLMIRRPPRSTLDRSSAASDVYKRQGVGKARADGVDDAGQEEFRAAEAEAREDMEEMGACLLYTSPSPRDRTRYRMPSSA